MRTLSSLRRVVAPASAVTAALTAAALTAGLALTGPATANEAPAPQRGPAEQYVALGDSAAAGPIIWPQQTGQPTPCLRSERNFPTIAAASLSIADVTDVTCSSAETRHLWEPQRDAAPQLDALTRDTTLVTFGPIGANDADLVSAVLGCLVPGCARRDGTKVHDRIEATRPAIAAALDEIESRAPRAETLVVGYGQYVRPGGCPLIQPLTRTDADYVRGLTAHMSRVLREEARAASATFVALDELPGAGARTACAPPGKRWLEGLLPTALDGSIPFHPTALGMRAFAAGVVAAAR